MNLHNLFKKELLELVTLKHPRNVDQYTIMAMSSGMDPDEAAEKLVRIGDATYLAKTTGQLVENNPNFLKSCY